MKPILHFLSIFLLVLFSTRCNQPEIQNIVARNTLDWNFPLKRTHTGILLGNGIQGLMIWGYGNQLNITVGRAGFWDHRGGNEFASRTNYEEVKRLLYAHDEAGLREAFAIPEKNDSIPNRPQQLGGGRIEIYFPEGLTLTRGTLILDNGTVLVRLKDASEVIHTVRIRQAIPEEKAWVVLPEYYQDSIRVEVVPTWDHVKDQLLPYGVQAPERWSDELQHGFLQTLPEDAPFALNTRRQDSYLILSTALGQDARARAEALSADFNPQQEIQEINQWWSDYWEDIPDIRLPDPVLQEIVDYGHYKQACATPPHGVACTLQGPFNEEYRLPPWSNDYHFNINIEMIYLPALASNRTDHLKPVWELIDGWMPRLRSNGEKFFGQDGAIMLPHAVDDRCQVVGSFWTGTIDHACTAWMAQLAWLHYRYSMDTDILEQTAWPLLNGAFEGYWAMLEEVRTPEGTTRLSLPVSVSPEFKGSRMDAWGRDASFQLAALHMLADILPRAAGILGEEADPRWEEVSRKLPPYTLIRGPRTLEWPENQVDRIALWEGMDLIESHRHHSYLGGIWPFMTYDPAIEPHREIVNHTLQNWVLKGPGLWSGWCVPWASVINSRTNQIRAAIEWLHWWKRNFTNEGRGTLHNAAFYGTSLISSPDYSQNPIGQEHNEIMQLDAGFGALTAVYEMLVQDRQGTIYILPRIPQQWKQVSFSNILTEGGFLVSADVSKGKRTQVVIRSQFDGPIRIAHGLGEACLLNGERMEGAVLEILTEAGETYTLTPP